MSDKSPYPRSAAGGLLFWGLVTGGRPAALLLSGLLTGAVIGWSVYRPAGQESVVTIGSLPPVVPVPALRNAMVPRVEMPLPDAAGRPEHRGGLLDQAHKVDDFQQGYRQLPEIASLAKLKAGLSPMVAVGAATESVVVQAGVDAAGTTRHLAALHLSGIYQLLPEISAACWSIVQPAEAMQCALDSDDPQMVGYTTVSYWRATREGALKLLPKLNARQMEAFVRPIFRLKPPVTDEERWQFIGAIQALPQPLPGDLGGFRIAFLSQAAEEDPDRVEAYLEKNGEIEDLHSTLLPSLALGRGKGDWLVAYEWLLAQDSEDSRREVPWLWRRWASEDRGSFERAMGSAPPGQKSEMERVLKAIDQPVDYGQMIQDSAGGSGE